MITISAALIKELRERTGIGIMECKKALVEAKGNIEIAIINMRKFGQLKAAKKARCVTAEGVILTKIDKSGEYGVIIELNCETDFVAKDKMFKTFADKIIMFALNEHVTSIDELKYEFEEQRNILITKFGENINIRRLGVIKGNKLGFYIHRDRIGVIVSAINANEKLINNIAMHIAASKPEYINVEDIPSYVISRERQIQLDIMIKSSKSPQIAKKIVEGRVCKFINEISLVNQPFVMDQRKTIGELLDEFNAKLNRFIRFEVGESV